MKVDLISVLLGGVSAIAIKVSFELIKEHPNEVSRWLIEKALLGLPYEEREEHRQSWLADNKNIEKPITKVINAFGCIYAVTSIRIEDAADKVKNWELDPLTLELGKRTAALGKFGIAFTSWMAMTLLPMLTATFVFTDIAIADRCPIVLDLNYDGQIGVTGTTTARYRPAHTLPGKGVWFDMNGDGHDEIIEWVDGSGDAFLIDNTDGQALQNMNGLRLFGNQQEHSNGYTKLQKWDANNDGMISGSELNGLALWVDDGDAIAESGEIQTLEENNITEIGTNGYQPITKKHDLQDTSYIRDVAFDSNGFWLMTEDIWFFSLPERNKEILALYQQDVREERLLNISNI